jgi:anti-sigma factor RsiW
MNCDRIEELIPRYLERDLGEEEERAIASHLASCAQCRRSLETFTELERSLRELEAAVPSWRMAEARLTRGLGLKRRRALPELVFTAPSLAGLSFIVLGIVLFLKASALAFAFRSVGARLAISLDAFTQGFSRLFADVAGLNLGLLLSIYGFLTIALMWGTGMLVLRFGRK